MNLGTFTFSNFITFMFQAMGKALKVPLWLSQEMVSVISLTLTVFNQQLEDTQKKSDHLSYTRKFLNLILEDTSVSSTVKQ